jgi:hypothetical protein
MAEHHGAEDVPPASAVRRALSDGRVAYYDSRPGVVPDVLPGKAPASWIACIGGGYPPAGAPSGGIPVVPYGGLRQIAHGDAEVRLLDGKAIEALLFLNGYPDAQYLLARLAPRREWLLGSVGALWKLALGRLAYVGVVKLPADGSMQRWLALEVKARITRSARHYLSEEVGVEGLLDFLAQQSVAYVVLRWYDDLPALGEGEDVDILIADEDLRKIRAYIHEHAGTIPLDIYSVSGSDGGAYRNMSYYPPSLARTLLENSVDGPGGSRIPSPRHAFFSLAYHALYHKGEASGLMTRLDGVVPLALPEHDYEGVLSRMAKELGFAPWHDMEDLDELLGEEGWRPPFDVLSRLSKRNQWVARRFFHNTQDELPGVAVFVVREMGLRRGFLSPVVEGLEEAGFEVLKVVKLAATAIPGVAEQLRGGNWKAGNGARDAGLPAAVIVAVDLDPTEPTPQQRQKMPNIDTGRLGVKHELREKLNGRLPPSEHSNFLHSSDNSAEAWSYVEICIPDATERLREAVAEHRERYRTPEQVVRRLSNGTSRGRVDLIRRPEGLAVRKTYRSSCAAQLRREVEVRTEVTPLQDVFAPPIEVGDNFIVHAHWEPLQPVSRWWLLPFRSVGDVAKLMADLHTAGYAALNLRPDNLVQRPEGGLALRDVEFVHRYEDPAPELRHSYDVIGVPKDFAHRLPAGPPITFERSWRPLVGLTFDSMLDDPVWVQRCKRALYWATHVPPQFLAHMGAGMLRGTSSRLVAVMAGLERQLRRRLVGMMSNR